MVDRRLGRVQVLRTVAFQQSGAEADGVAAQVVDGEHDATTETIDERPAPGPGAKTRKRHDFVPVALFPQVGGELLPATR